jgi:hypothetical protein
MTERVLGPTGSPRRRWTLLLPLAAVIAVSLYYVAGAQAVHDLAFQLDGETTNTAYSPPPNSSPNTDWNDIFTAVGANTSVVNPANNPGFTHADFVRDFGVKDPTTKDCSFTSTDTTKDLCTKDFTTFATGSKDTLNITPGWQCNVDNNVNNKIDIMNAYAASYTASNGDHIIYFGMEKNVDNGVNDVGFWFLQGNADCTGSPGGGTAWSGTHVVGDVLVVSEFSNGGGVSNVTAYKWVGGNNPLVPLGQGGDCKTTTGGDNLCATTNAFSTDASSPASHPWNENVTTKWVTANGSDVGNTVVPPDFFEGGINITKIFTAAGGGTVPSCFNTFVGDTRSSKETGATLFDYARGVLGECSATIHTTPSLTTTTLSSSDPITDLANVAGASSTGGSAPKPTGTISFFLCGPGVTSCTTGGQAVGSAVTLGDCNPDVAGHSCATSANVRSLVTAGGAGTYCFRAVYDPLTDPNYQGSKGILDGSATECFTVTGNSSSSSQQRWLPNDRVTLTGDSNLNGTLTVTLYKGTFAGTASNCTVGTGVAVTGQSYGPITVNPGSTSFTYNTTNTTFVVGTNSDGTTTGAGTDGTYFWLIHYADNNLSSPTDRCETSTISHNDG